MFAYVGGLCIFLATFSQILIHYIIRFFLDTSVFICKLFSRHRTSGSRQLFISSEEIEELGDDADARFRSTELHHAATEEIYSRISFDTPDGGENDETDMGNILINASIG